MHLSLLTALVYRELASYTAGPSTPADAIPLCVAAVTGGQPLLSRRRLSELLAVMVPPCVIFTVLPRLDGVAADQFVKEAVITSAVLSWYSRARSDLVEFLEELIPGNFLEVVIIRIWCVGKDQSNSELKVRRFRADLLRRTAAGQSPVMTKTCACGRFGGWPKPRPRGRSTSARFRLRYSGRPRQIGSDTGAIAALLDPAGARQDRLEAPHGKYIRK